MRMARFNAANDRRPTELTDHTGIWEIWDNITPMRRFDAVVAVWLGWGNFFLSVYLFGLGTQVGEAEELPTQRGSRPKEVQWFTEITTEVGLDFTHEAGATGEFHLPEIMASGAALFDFDNDGDLDIYLTNGNRALPLASTAESPLNRLFRQEPDRRFVDVTAESGLGDGGYGMGVALGDIDNDGDVDIYVTNYGPDRLYRNSSAGTFADVTLAAGIMVDGWSSSAAFFDYDLDGFLDLYVARYVVYKKTRENQCVDGAGRPDYCSPRVFLPVPDVLLHNNGDGTFTDVSQSAGITSISAAGLGVICEDLNNDGWTDVYVANDMYANQLWINQGDGTFRDEALLKGVAYNLHGQAEASMGVVAADVDNDGNHDLFLTHLRFQSNTLLRNLGGARGFTDVTGESGLGRPSMPYTGFGTVALDVEHDGDLDLVVVNGRVMRDSPVPGVVVPPPWDRYAEPNQFFLNTGAGRFTLAGAPVEALCGPTEVSRGLAMGDIDSDGDIDLLISNIQGTARLYRNDLPGKGHWLGVRAVDPRLQRDAIGARITIVHDNSQQVRTISRGFSYLSSSDPRAHFGLGGTSKVKRIEVRWPDGLRELFPGVSADQVKVLVRGTGEALP